MVTLLHLPQELLDQILSILTEEKPLSAKLLHEEPSISLLQSPCHPLKDLSQTCSTARELCFPTLFSAVKVDLSNTAGFLAFSETCNLSNYADSLVLCFDPIHQSRDVHGYKIWSLMVQIVDSVKTSVMTAVLDPSLFATILPYELNLTDVWAFDIPFQVLRLEMPRHLARSSQVSQNASKSRNVFQLREWSHCTFNQGSSVKGYSSYEYFLKQTPSIFHPRDRLVFSAKMTPGSLENLTSLDYVAMFPINHVQHFTIYLSKMTNLKCLRVQFAPTLNNNVLDEPSKLRKCQPKDLWQEFESCYDTLTRIVCTIWIDVMIPLEEFVSLDYANPNLRQTIDRLVTRTLFSRDFEPGSGSWARKEFYKYHKVPTEELVGYMGL